MAIYQIRVKGHLDPSRSLWFEGLTVRPAENGETILVGPLPDEAALHGILIKVRDLHLPLLAVRRIESESPITPGSGDGIQPRRAPVDDEGEETP